MLPSSDRRPDQATLPHVLRRSHHRNTTQNLWERGLPAMNDNAVYRANRAGQPMMFFGRGVA
ncbi:hypothetical protein DOZ80_10910 [Pseudomonas fluorescens]|uniref:Uncharacterized protein n=1 Tax=Pseudomonas fluorescens TaxID=294 RepID=A0A327N7Z8_PSEFL|nr:hypothetical protein DOZ80_10910 [Pseudomonas fluorescens]